MNKTELSQVAEYFKLLAGVEAGLGAFYSLCHEYWPEEDLWASVAVEEKIHTEAVFNMLKFVEAAPEKFTLLRPLVLKPLTLFLEGLRANEAKVRSGAYRKINAMAVSKDIESSLIESRYDKILESGHPGYNVTLSGMLEDTRRHGAAFACRLATLKIIK